LVRSQEVNDTNKQLRINQLQYIGTHNSYHIEPEQGISLLFHKDERLKQAKPRIRSLLESLRYTHLPLTTQLDLGIRKIELDVLYDPDGGKFSSPAVFRALAAAGIPLEFPYDTLGELSKPGFKIIHIPDVDVRSTCLALVKCLQQIKQWSIENPRHLPLMIQLEAKQKSFSLINTSFDAVKIQPFSKQAWRDLEEEILTVFSREQLITPSSVTRPGLNLRDSVLSHGWPTLGMAAGKLMFSLDNTDETVARYLASKKGQDKLLFVSVGIEHEQAAWIKLNDAYDPSIPKRVAQGFIVRSRADVNMVEAIKGDPGRREKAFASGAHYISTDYPYPDARLSSYFVRFENGNYVRCNPLTYHGKCPL
jgi:hypothetical protein